MFHTLNKLAKLALFSCFVGVVSGVCYYAYDRREVWYTPLEDFWTVTHIEAPLNQEMLEHWDGRVTKVLSGDQFVMKSSAGLCSVRLTGLEAPLGTNRLDKVSVETARRSFLFLSSMILSNDVRVAVTYIPAREIRSGMGIVFLGGTNVNTAVVESGNARARLDFMKGLPRNIQYGLIKAERRARKNAVGLWASLPESLTTSGPAL